MLSFHISDKIFFSSKLKKFINSSSIQTKIVRYSILPYSIAIKFFKQRQHLQTKGMKL